MGSDPWEGKQPQTVKALHQRIFCSTVEPCNHEAMSPRIVDYLPINTCKLKYMYSLDKEILLKQLFTVNVICRHLSYFKVVKYFIVRCDFFLFINGPFYTLSF